MTALRKYQRLESLGLWRDGAAAQKREVVVGFREATLILADPRTETPLSHWSLPAIIRLNPGEMPALYGPGAEPFESLELEDSEMIAALETVSGAVARSRPRKGRLRGWLMAGTAATFALLGVFWLPAALIERTAEMLPISKRAQIGQLALRDLTRLTGLPCASSAGNHALERIAERIFGPGAPQLLVMREGLPRAAHLPGNVILLGRPLIENSPGPETAAGFALVEDMRAKAEDPVIPILRHAGLRATLNLLTTGELPPDSVAGYGEVLLGNASGPSPADFDTESLLKRFGDAGLASSPYAYSLDPSGESTLSLIEADPLRDKPAARGILPDDAWVGLQEICAR
jgi:hypothetical protein